ncbi:MAG: SseB family protein [Sporichthyaceae bacterium]
MSQPHRAPGDKHIPNPGFADDDGSADPALTAALADWTGGATVDGVLAALLGARLLIPVIAIATDVDVVTGADKATVRDASERGTSEERERTSSTDMALPTITGADGRRAVPAFTSLATMAAWRGDARPVPVAATTAALATVAEEAHLLVIDAGGPVTFRIEGPALRALAQSRLPIPPHLDPDVLGALRTVVERESALELAVLLPRGAGQDVDAILGLGLAPEAVPEAPALATRIAQALAEVAVLRERLDGGLDLALLPAQAVLPATGCVILVDRRGLVG